MTPGLRRLVFQLLAAAAVVSGFFVCAFAVSQFQELRQLERLPRSAPGLVMPGVVSVSGEVREHARLLQSPETKTPCVYFLRTVEHQEQEPGGEKRWRLVGSRTMEGRVPFHLGAESGETLVDLALGSPKVTARQRHQHVRIPNRYTEYRIEPGDAIHVLGVAGSSGDSVVIGFEHEGPHQMVATYRPETTLRALLGGLSGGLVFVGLSLLTLGVRGRPRSSSSTRAGDERRSPIRRDESSPARLSSSSEGPRRTRTLRGACE